MCGPEPKDEITETWGEYWDGDDVSVVPLGGQGVGRNVMDDEPVCPGGCHPDRDACCDDALN